MQLRKEQDKPEYRGKLYSNLMFGCPLNSNNFYQLVPIDFDVQIVCLNKMFVFYSFLHMNSLSESLNGLHTRFCVIFAVSSAQFICFVFFYATGL